MSAYRARENNTYAGSDCHRDIFDDSHLVLLIFGTIVIDASSLYFCLLPIAANNGYSREFSSIITMRAYKSELRCLAMCSAQQRVSPITYQFLLRVFGATRWKFYFEARTPIRYAGRLESISTRILFTHYATIVDVT